MPDAPGRPVRIGYKLSSEEFSGPELVRLARAAEDHGFDFAMISDHFHPWLDRQGQSPFVWSVLGAIAQATRRLVVGTAVTCPTIRIHPAIIAQAAATTATMMPGRFLLGLGTGENLNEHITGHRWPPTPVRQEMLGEAIVVLRLLWQGGLKNHHGQYFTVENARIYSLPEAPPPILVAASGPKSAELAGRLADGLIGVDATNTLIEKFRAAGGIGRPCYAELNVCVADDEQKARQFVAEHWPIAAVSGPMYAELPLPSHYQHLSRMIRPEDVRVPVGPDPEPHIRGLRQYLDAGYDHVFVHQIGPEQDRFLEFYAREVIPRVRY